MTLDRAEGESGDGWCSQEWTYPGVAGDRVWAEVTLPEEGEPEMVVIAAHGITSSGDALYIRGAARSWARRGVATVAPDAPLHGHRASGEAVVDALQMGSERVYRQAVGDLGAAVEAISDAGWGDLPLGYLGFSMGTLTGVAFLATEPPVQAAVLTIGGSTVVAGEDRHLDWVRHGVEVAARTDPATFAPEVTRPWVRMMNADQDEVFSRRSALALYDALACPKELVFFPGRHASWSEPAERYRSMLAFFRRHLHS